MKIKESELEDFLFHEMFNPATLFKNTGLDLWSYDCHFRQVNLGPYGVADLIALEYVHDVDCLGKEQNRINVHLIELKSGSILPEAYLQTIRYAAGIRHFFSDFVNTSRTEIYIDVRLIGCDFRINAIDFQPLPGLINVVTGYWYDYKDGTIKVIPIEHTQKLAEEMSWNKIRGNQSFYKLFKSKMRLMVGSWQERERKYKIYLNGKTK